MAKRQRLTVEQILEDISDDEDYDDPDEPMMEGSDDDFSDLEMDEDDLYDPMDTALPALLPLNNLQMAPPQALHVGILFSINSKTYLSIFTLQ